MRIVELEAAWGEEPATPTAQVQQSMNRLGLRQPARIAELVHDLGSDPQGFNTLTHMVWEECGTLKKDDVSRILSYEPVSWPEDVRQALFRLEDDETERMSAFELIMKSRRSAASSRLSAH